MLLSFKVSLSSFSSFRCIISTQEEKTREEREYIQEWQHKSNTTEGHRLQKRHHAIMSWSWQWFVSLFESPSSFRLPFLTAFPDYFSWLLFLTAFPDCLFWHTAAFVLNFLDETWWCVHTIVLRDEESRLRNEFLVDQVWDNSRPSVCWSSRVVFERSIWLWLTLTLRLCSRLSTWVVSLSLNSSSEN